MVQNSSNFNSKPAKFNACYAQSPHWSSPHWSVRGPHIGRFTLFRSLMYLYCLLCTISTLVNQGPPYWSLHSFSVPDVLVLLAVHSLHIGQSGAPILVASLFFGA